MQFEVGPRFMQFLVILAALFIVVGVACAPNVAAVKASVATCGAVAVAWMATRARAEG